MHTTGFSVLIVARAVHLPATLREDENLPARRIDCASGVPSSRLWRVEPAPRNRFRLILAFRKMNRALILLPPHRNR